MANSQCSLPVGPPSLMLNLDPTHHQAADLSSLMQISFCIQVDRAELQALLLLPRRLRTASQPDRLSKSLASKILPLMEATRSQ